MSDIRSSFGVRFVKDPNYDFINLEHRLYPDPRPDYQAYSSLNNSVVGGGPLKSASGALISQIDMGRSMDSKYKLYL